MYNVLKLNVTGPAAALLEHTEYPSYVQAIIILTKHYNLSRLQRVQGAFDTIDKINYSGDPMAFQVTFMAAKREMDNVCHGEGYPHGLLLRSTYEGVRGQVQDHPVRHR